MYVHMRLPFKELWKCRLCKSIGLAGYWGGHDRCPRTLSYRNLPLIFSFAFRCPRSPHWQQDEQNLQYIWHPFAPHPKHENSIQTKRFFGIPFLIFPTWERIGLQFPCTTIQKVKHYRNLKIQKKLPQLDQVWQGFSCNDDWASKRLRCLRFRCKKRGKEGEIARGLIPLKKNGKQGGESSVCNLFDWDLFNVGHSNCHLMRKQTTGIVKFLTLNLLSGGGWWVVRLSDWLDSGLVVDLSPSCEVILALVYTTTCSIIIEEYWTDLEG